MRIIRVPFSRSFLVKYGGISRELFKSMLDQLPKDAELVGFGSDLITCVDYMFVKSDQFINTPDGNVPPDCPALFSKSADGTVICHGVDYGSCLESGIVCQHYWTFYQGLSDSFEYCAKCNEKKK